ncbi:alpha/beta-Hydrolases superfamily protein [Striga asiatica]|uniref:Alpha/beta-Hydrolases superfamily protein n=1 Tax=Striga asiatica TaxID=4170 RepID=A0A5A7Q260_STRAF|nr:alpha/beta-Hydrolases superfamily protein [Striga asiatica]
MANKKNTKSQPANLPFITRLKLFILKLPKPFTIPLENLKTRAPTKKLINGTLVTTSDIKIDPSRNLWFRLFIPSSNYCSENPLPLIVYFHGGGFRSFGPDNIVFHDLCSQLASKIPAVVLSVNYRLAPEHKFPAPYEDALRVLKFVDKHNRDVLPEIADLSKCFLMGDSAGGNIAHHATIRALKNGDSFEKLRIEGVIGLQPFFGGEERTDSELRLTRAPIIDVKITDECWKIFLPDGANRNHSAAHVFGGPGSDELKDVLFPRSLVFVGGYDPLRDWGRRYAEGLRSCGTQVELIDYENAFHGFYCFPELPEYASLLEEVVNFIRKQESLD